jgi:hypothetical protein
MALTMVHFLGQTTETWSHPQSIYLSNKPRERPNLQLQGVKVVADLLKFEPYTSMIHGYNQWTY